MTNLDAIKAKMFPYEVPEETLEFLLDEQGLTSSAAYSRDANYHQLLRAIIQALYQLITLVKEKDNGSEIQYDPDAMQELIKRYSRELPDDENEIQRPQNRDMSEIW